MFRSEIVSFLRDQFRVDVLLSSITRLLQREGWSIKSSSHIDNLERLAVQ